MTEHTGSIPAGVETRPDAQLRLLVFGLGYTGVAIALAAQAAGFTVTATSRDPNGRRAPAGIRLLPFDAAGPEIATATHVVATIPVGEGGDLVLDRYGPALAGLGVLRWAGYLSTTGVYGDRGGAWVDEETEPCPASPRTRRRRAAELAWSDLPCAVDLFRVAGIYGPGRSPFDALRAGTAHRIIKPGHQFGRIHRDDIAAALVAAMAGAHRGEKRVFNLSDDEPAEAATVTEEAARLLGIAPPPPTPFADAVRGMSAMGRSFWSENRKVDSRKTQARLGLRWHYPTYREGLRAILAAEGREQGSEGPGQQA